MKGSKNETELKTAIKKQMVHASVVLVHILSGVYSTYSKWNNQEIYLAQNRFDLPKPINTIEPWCVEKTSFTVKDADDKIVGENTNTIVDAIKNH